ncbi:HAD family hydrolase [Tsukamurella pulmonis]|uniref:Trehalose 6-phosphate phosphatase n=1 Tax=Tsukamurella pulmonis TaxID=47312 RepID=A0A1H1C0F5_9ACTN|nr:trehalose-phosphatase [Tsukamurella pulmonis]KXO90121.1 HAD family hydrolase [Tsukamurella pulmonis]SDQ57619.1 trehalose 6-phosphatase [Tsukamurella pulmonis]SUP24413.1 Trehalose-phosphate phosphatase [Tsukamurella pulmonis]
MTLRAALERFAALDTVLVATDYDGVVAPIVADPAAAFPLPGTVPALTSLAALPGVTVALVSGRDRATLGRLSGAAAPLVTVGSHGAEWEEGLEGVLSPALIDLRASVLADLTAIAERFPGAAVEPKPLGAALHVRNVVDPSAGPLALEQARRGPAALPGVHATDGKAVLELTVLDASKGRALTVLRERTGADGVLYLGDDVTDEKAFAVLTGPEDVSVKVGDGATAARFRVDAPADARAVFEELLALRRA